MENELNMQAKLHVLYKKDQVIKVINRDYTFAIVTLYQDIKCYYEEK